MLKEYHSNPVITIGYLEGVAGIRFAVMEVASLLHSDCLNATAMRTSPWQYQLIQCAVELCADPAINTTDFASSTEDVIGPAVYLLKLLVRQYGFPCLKQVSDQHQWIIPEGLRTANQVA